MPTLTPIRNSFVALNPTEADLVLAAEPGDELRWQHAWANDNQPWSMGALRARLLRVSDGQVIAGNPIAVSLVDVRHQRVGFTLTVPAGLSGLHYVQYERPVLTEVERLYPSATFEGPGNDGFSISTSPRYLATFEGRSNLASLVGQQAARWRIQYNGDVAVAWSFESQSIPFYLDIERDPIGGYVVGNDLGGPPFDGNVGLQLYPWPDLLQTEVFMDVPVANKGARYKLRYRVRHIGSERIAYSISLENASQVGSTESSLVLDHTIEEKVFQTTSSTTRLMIRLPRAADSSSGIILDDVSLVEVLPEATFHIQIPLASMTGAAYARAGFKLGGSTDQVAKLEYAFSSDFSQGVPATPNFLALESPGSMWQSVEQSFSSETQASLYIRLRVQLDHGQEVNLYLDELYIYGLGSYVPCGQSSRFCIGQHDETSLVRWGGFESLTHGFSYQNGWFQQLRLPLYVAQPVGEETIETDKMSSGFERILYAELNERYTVFVPVMPGEQALCLHTALLHDYLMIDGQGFSYRGGITTEYPNPKENLAQLQFTAFATPVNSLNLGIGYGTENELLTMAQIQLILRDYQKTEDRDATLSNSNTRYPSSKAVSDALLGKANLIDGKVPLEELPAIVATSSQGEENDWFSSVYLSMLINRTA